MCIIYIISVNFHLGIISLIANIDFNFANLKLFLMITHYKSYIYYHLVLYGYLGIWILCIIFNDFIDFFLSFLIDYISLSL